MDEPTSALDPTMVGEVQAVIRDLAKTGKTMMIVTHEMNFAKAISNRIFYMDEGGIYEDGTPEQIFEHPEQENTRRFVRKLKVLELNINSRDYDFLGFASQIDVWCSKNQITPKLKNRIQLIFEEASNLLSCRIGSKISQPSGAAVLKLNSSIGSSMSMYPDAKGPISYGAKEYMTQSSLKNTVPLRLTYS